MIDVTLIEILQDRHEEERNAGRKRHRHTEMGRRNNGGEGREEEKNTNVWNKSVGEDAQE